MMPSRKGTDDSVNYRWAYVAVSGEIHKYRDEPSYKRNMKTSPLMDSHIERQVDTHIHDMHMHLEKE